MYEMYKYVKIVRLIYSVIFRLYNCRDVPVIAVSV